MSVATNILFSFIFFALIFHGAYSKFEGPRRPDRLTCLAELKDCENQESVCGIKKEGEGFRLRIFETECDLIKFKCGVNKEHAYERSPMRYCKMVFRPDSETNTCTEYDCTHPTDDVQVCAATNHPHYKFRLFENKCRMWEHNCIHQEQYVTTELSDCKDLTIEPENQNPETNEGGKRYDDKKPYDTVKPYDARKIKDIEKTHGKEKHNIMNTNELGDGYIYVNGVKLREDKETHIIMEDNSDDIHSDGRSKYTTTLHYDV